MIYKIIDAKRFSFDLDYSQDMGFDKTKFVVALINNIDYNANYQLVYRLRDINGDMFAKSGFFFRISEKGKNRSFYKCFVLDVQSSVKDYRTELLDIDFDSCFVDFFILKDK
jgi:hypothetical protein